MIYPLTFYVKSLPPNIGGDACGPVIRILTTIDVNSRIIAGWFPSEIRPQQ